MKSIAELKELLVENARANSAYLGYNVECNAHGEMWQERFIAVLNLVDSDVRYGNESMETYKKIKSEMDKYL